MNQLVAMQVRPPDFDYSKVVDTVQRQKMNEQRITGAEMDNQLAGMKLDEATAQHGAETDYRQRSAAGDPNADEALSGYPEMQKQIWDAFDGMDPKTYKAAKQKATRFGDAARAVLMFPDGTPEQKSAWDVEIGKLAEEGIIPQEQAVALIKSGPNPLIIDQALSVEEFAKTHGTKGRLEQKKAETALKREERISDNIEADNIRADEELDFKKEKAEANEEISRARIKLAQEKAEAAADRIDKQLAQKEKDAQGRSDREDDKLGLAIEKEVRAFRKDLKIDDDPELETDKPEVYKRLTDRLEAFQTRLLKRYGFGPDGRRTKGRALGADEVDETGGDGSSAEAAAKPASRADYDKLPKGAYFINPADGKLKRKP